MKWLRATLVVTLMLFGLSGCGPKAEPPAKTAPAANSSPHDMSKMKPGETMDSGKTGR